MNDFVLIDSSCWIHFFRNSDIKIADTVQMLIENELASLCGITELEILQGIKSTKQTELVNNVFSFLKYFEIIREDFINAGEMIRGLRIKGITMAMSDVLISQICIRNNIRILTTDNDFRYIKDLKHYNI